MINDIKKLLESHFWLPFVIICYIPTVKFMANNVWTTSDQAHGPLILLIVSYLFWTKKDLFLNENYITNKRLLLGYVFVILALTFYVIGRSQKILPLDLASLMLLITGITLIKSGFTGLKQLWFPIFFIFFLIPLPGFIVSAITLPMKVAVSIVAEKIIYLFNYPIARSGVMLQIGQYQLLVADACAGLQTLLSLEAIGLLYLNLIKHPSFLRNITLAIMIIPISFTANVIRVICLILITFYFGASAGQGFIHDFSGLLLFVIALTLIICLDSLMRKLKFSTK